MTAHETRELYAYVRWANDLILEAVEPLSHEQFTRDLKNSFPSIRDTLGHMLAAEWVWLSRWNGESPRTFMPGWNSFTYAELRARWTRHNTDLDKYLAGLTDDQLARPLAYTNLAGTSLEVRLDALLRHVVNHSTYHRGQVVTMLRQLECKAPSTDFVLFHTSGAALATTTR